MSIIIKLMIVWLGFLTILIDAKAIDIFDVGSMQPVEPNYCNNRFPNFRYRKFKIMYNFKIELLIFWKNWSRDVTF